MNRVRRFCPVSGTVVGILFLTAVSACAPAEREGIDPSPEVRAPEKVEQAFHGVIGLEETDALRVDGKNYLAIRKNALEKEYLLSASFIPQRGAATSTGLGSRVVAFRQVNDEVFMMEATQGHIVTEDLPAQLILTSFPMVSEDADSVVIDFDKGMNKVYAVSNWYGSDFEGTEYKDAATTVAVDVENSFIDSIKIQNNRLEIRQLVQFGMKASGASNYPTYEMRYILQPYAPNPSYTPRETSDFKTVGYFEVNPQLETKSGRGIVRISRWDHSKPITYVVSANTPKDYVDAVKEGITYWNKAFGREVMKAEVAPAGVTAPTMDYNIIQWVPWDSAGFAYADALMDPRSGEILQAQAYLTSVFAFGSKIKARNLLRVLQEANKSRPHGHGATLHPRFMSSTRLCDFEMSEIMARHLSGALTAGADDATLLRISRDYVRLVVAHEVGHTLGLRHNFAGSLATTLSLAERDRLFADYVKTGKTVDPRDHTVSSSVMDYMTFADDVILGSQMAAMDAALTYDLQAIRWSYDGRAISKSKAPLFCTDSNVAGRPAGYADCLRFDEGAGPVEYRTYSMMQNMRQLPTLLLETFLEAKTAIDPRDRMPVEEVLPYAAGVAEKFVTDHYDELLKWMGRKVRSLRVHRQFPAVSPLNRDEVQAAQYVWVVKQIETLGKLEDVLFPILPDMKAPNSQIAEEGYKKFVELLESKFRSGEGMDGKPYSFTEEEMAAMKKIAQVFFARFEQAVIEGMLTKLATVKFEEESTAAEIEARLPEIARAVILTQSDERVEWVAEEWLKKAQPDLSKLKGFRYSLNARLRAVEILAAARGPESISDWSEASRKALEKELTELVEAALGQKLSEVKTSELPRPIRHWLAEQKKVISRI